MEKLQELVQNAANNCFLEVKYGGFVGDDWIELYGPGVDSLKRLVDMYNQEGKIAFSTAFGPVVERHLETKIKELSEALGSLRKECPDGVPYTEEEARLWEEIARTQDRPDALEIYDLIGASEIFDYVARRLRCHRDFLNSYQKGEPLKVLVEPTVVPFQSRVFKEGSEAAIGAFADSKVVVMLQKRN